MKGVVENENATAKLLQSNIYYCTAVKRLDENLKLCHYVRTNLYKTGVSKK